MRFREGATFLSLARAGSIAGSSIINAPLRHPLRLDLPPSFWSSVNRLTTTDPWPPANSASAAQFVEKCYWHGLLPLLFADRELPAIVERARDAARGWEWILCDRARLFHEAIVKVCHLLAGEPFALIKGADYAHRLYPERSLRPMQDIDILVPAGRMDAVCGRVQDAGFVLNPNVDAASDPTSHEREFVMGILLVDVHQSFAQRPRHRIDYGAIWERRVPLEIGDQSAFRLEDADALAYHALSMALDQLHVRLIRFVDLWLLLRQREGVALVAAERARDWHAARALYAALSQVCRLFPEFHTSEVSAAMSRVLSARARRFVDRWVLPGSAELHHGRRPPRSLQLWRKACLMDSLARCVTFAFSHAVTTVRGWFFKSTGPKKRSLAA
jgi:hypothetical protein